MTRIQIRWAARCAAAAILFAGEAWSGLGDPVPANPCPGAAPLRSKYAVLDVSSDGAVLCAGNLVDTQITCTIKDVAPAAASTDLLIQYFDDTGAPMNPVFAVGVDAFCGVVPGASFTFHLSPLPAPLVPVGAIPGFAAIAGTSAFCGIGFPGCMLHGSARILSSSRKIQCTGARIDMINPCLTAFAVPPMARKNLTVIKLPMQLGD